jgi:hypothetical protein
MKMPLSSTLRYKVCYALFEHGSMTARQAKDVLPALSAHNVCQALKGAAETGYVTRIGHTYTLNQQLADCFASMGAEKTEYIGQIVPAPTFTVNRPLKSLPTDIHKDRLREVSFKNGSTDFRAFVGYLAG